MYLHCPYVGTTNEDHTPSDHRDSIDSPAPSEVRQGWQLALMAILPS